MVQRNGHDVSGGEFVTIACPECFRAFPQAINGTTSLVLDTSCVFCHSRIRYSIVDFRSLEFPRRFQTASAFAHPSTLVDQPSD
jgi:hypothetical protein